jgi:uncharacterized protein (TIGR00255 family)
MKPVASMTGFAVASRPTALGALTVELKSVNSRFLDLSLRYPDELRSVEPAVREVIAARVNRGKMECRLSLARLATDSAAALNAAALERLGALAAQAAAAVPGAAPLALADILAWPGVVDAPAADPEALRAAVLDTLAEALDALAASREREGAALRRVLLGHCDAVDAIAVAVKARAPDLLAAVERKLAERLEQALGKALADASTLTREEVSDRIRQELTLYGLRMDVDEEIKRLATHVTEVRRVLDAGGPVGRRLDFLMQELNREANTLGSKAAAIEMTNASVDLKLLIEQMREQIQNME